MGVLDRVSRWVMGGDAAMRLAAVEALAQVYVDCMRRTAQLRAHADLAPQAYSVTGLQALAGDEEAHAQLLREALDRRGREGAGGVE